MSDERERASQMVLEYMTEQRPHIVKSLIEIQRDHYEATEIRIPLRFEYPGVVNRVGSLDEPARYFGLPVFCDDVDKPTIVVERDSTPTYLDTLLDSVFDAFDGEVPE